MPLSPTNIIIDTCVQIRANHLRDSNLQSQHNFSLCITAPQQQQIINGLTPTHTKLATHRKSRSKNPYHIRSNFLQPLAEEKKIDTYKPLITHSSQPIFIQSVSANPKETNSYPSTQPEDLPVQFRIATKPSLNALSH